MIAQAGNSRLGGGISPSAQASWRIFLGLSVAVFWLLISGCSALSARRAPPRPGRTTLVSPLVVLPAQNISNFLVIEAKWDRYGPYHFLLDTGSSVTLVSPALAKRYPSRDTPVPNAPRLRIPDAEGKVVELATSYLRRLELGDARFEDVPVAIYDFARESAHLGVKIDGLLGFPLFRETLLTLDYPGSRVLLQPTKTTAPTPGTIIAFDDSRKTPLISVRLGDRTLAALIDSGSDAAFSLNPVGLDPQIISGRRAGITVGTIAGDRQQDVARLNETLAIGDQLFERPIVDLTDELSAIGGGALKHFAITFDQEHDRVTFYRDSRESILSAPRRSAGLSFGKTPAYWRVIGVVPASPADASGVQTGDLVTRINDEPVAKWDLRRYEQLVATSPTIAFTFLNGATETEKRVGVFDLVP